MSGVVLQLHYAKWRQVHAVLWQDLKANTLLSTETWAQVSARVKMSIEVSWLFSVSSPAAFACLGIFTYANDYMHIDKEGC